MSNLLSIRHETLYRYSEPARYSIQQLRLTPRQEEHQRMLSWKIDAPGARNAFADAYGNLAHTLTIMQPHAEVRIVVEGKVQVDAPDRGRIADRNTLSPLLYTVATPLTRADEALTEFAFRSFRRHPGSSDLLGLAGAICDAVVYRSGSTDVTSSAADAFALRQGVCQDHAHLFLACCHVLGVPARYVSGYIDSGSTHRAESHAWIDAWVEEGAYAGWVSVDVTHAALQGASLCRLAVGRDYDSAAPVRGVRRGGGQESLAVDVSVQVATAGNQ